MRVALFLVGSYVEAFAGYDAIVTPSASCAGSVRHQRPALVAGTALEDRAREAGSRTYELSQFLSTSSASTSSSYTRSRNHD